MSNEDPRFTRRNVLAGLAGVTAVSAAAGIWTPRSVRAEERSGVAGPTVVVIGAGIAGLSAAYELKKKGFRVSIFEKENYTGGRMRDAWMGPFYGFVHAAGVFQANQEMFSLAEELKIRDQLDPLYPRGEEGQVENEFGTYATSNMFDSSLIRKVPGLSEDAKRALPKLLADLDRIEQEVDPCQMASGASWDDETVAEYYERMLGKKAGTQFVRFWVDPILEWWGWPADMTSKIAILSWYAQKKYKFVAPKGGIGCVTRKLNELLNVQHEVSVQSISGPDVNGRHTVHYLTPELERRTITPDIVVCATEGRYLNRLIRNLTPAQDDLAKSVFTTKEAIIFWVLDEKAAPAEPIGGSYIPTHPDSFKHRVNSWSVVPANSGDHLGPAHIRIDLSRPEVPKWQVSGKTMPEYCEPLIKHFYPAFDMRNVTDMVNYTCDDLIYMPVGYCKKIAKVLDEQAKERRGLYLAGEYVSGAHTGAACASGRTVARLISQHWRA